MNLDFDASEFEEMLSDEARDEELDNEDSEDNVEDVDFDSSDRDNFWNESDFDNDYRKYDPSIDKNFKHIEDLQGSPEVEDEHAKRENKHTRRIGIIITCMAFAVLLLGLNYIRLVRTVDYSVRSCSSSIKNSVADFKVSREQKRRKVAQDKLDSREKLVKFEDEDEYSTETYRVYVLEEVLGSDTESGWYKTALEKFDNEQTVDTDKTADELLGYIDTKVDRMIDLNSTTKLNGYSYEEIDSAENEIVSIVNELKSFCKENGITIECYEAIEKANVNNESEEESNEEDNSESNDIKKSKESKGSMRDEIRNTLNEDDEDLAVGNMDTSKIGNSKKENEEQVEIKDERKEHNDESDLAKFVEGNTQNGIDAVAENSSTDNWKEVNSVDAGESVECEADFTVAEVKHFETTEGSKIYKTRLTGIIKNVGNNVEIEIPYEKGKYIEIGDTFQVKVYVAEDKDGNLVITSIDTKGF